MARTGEQLWNYGDWMMRAQLEAKRARKYNPLLYLLDRERYSYTDYNVEQVKEDLWRSYNKKTGEELFLAQSESEAWQDLKEEFLKGA